MYISSTNITFLNDQTLTSFLFSCAKPLLVSEQQVRVWTQSFLCLCWGQGILLMLFMLLSFSSASKDFFNLFRNPMAIAP